MSITKKVFGFLPEDIADCFDEILKKHIKQLVAEFKLNKFLNELDEVITKEYDYSLMQLHANEHEGMFSERLKNYKIIPKIFNYWIGLEQNYISSEEMIEKLTEEITKDFSSSEKNNVKDLLFRINRYIFDWLLENANENQKIFLFLTQHFEKSNNKLIDEINKCSTDDDYIVINKISKGLCKTIIDRMSDNNACFEDLLFGHIKIEGGGEATCLKDLIDSSLPSVLFLVGDGGVGKTTHLVKFQSDIFSALSHGDTQKAHHYIPIFISLTHMSRGETIKHYILENYPIHNLIVDEEKLSSVFSQQNSSICYIFMLDGLNEYQGETEELFKEINSMRKKENVRFIITSRYSSSDINISSEKLCNISEAVVEHISVQQACDYFGIDSFPVDYNEKTMDLVTTPFYMKICNELNYDFTTGVNINASILMCRYMHHNMSRYNDLGKTVIRDIFPYLCYTCYRKDSVAGTDNKANGEVVLTPFGTKDIKDVTNAFNERFDHDIQYEDVITILIECNYITKTKKNNPIVRYNFKHQNIRDIYAAYYVASMAWLILDEGDNLSEDFGEDFGSEIEMHSELRDFSSDVSDSLLAFLVEMNDEYNEEEKINKYREYANDDSSMVILDGNDKRCIDLRESENLIILEILDKISIYEKDKINYAQKFIEKYEKSKNSNLKDALANMYIFALCQLAKYYRLPEYSKINALESFEKCLDYSERAKTVYDDNNKCNSDGYNHIGKCLNSFLEYILNEMDFTQVIEDTSYSLLKKTMLEINFANSIVNKCKSTNNDIAPALLPILTSAKGAYNSYCQSDKIDKRVLHILALNYVSRAYMAEACLNNSAESLNLMAMILENDYNVKLHDMILEQFKVNIPELEPFIESRFKLCYDLYDAASKCSHIVRGYSAQKKAIMLIKQVVKLENVESEKIEIERDLNISKRANKPLTEYWYGRYNKDILGNTQHSESHYKRELQRFRKNSDDLRTQKLDTSLMLVKIEMLPFFNVDEINHEDICFIDNIIKNLTFDSLDNDYVNSLTLGKGLRNEIIYIIKCLNDQKLSIKNQKIKADKFWVATKTVEENLSRFLSNLGTILSKLEG